MKANLFISRLVLNPGTSDENSFPNLLRKDVIELSCYVYIFMISLYLIGSETKGLAQVKLHKHVPLETSLLEKL